MANYDTVRAITDNIESALKREGIHFSRAVYEDDRAIPASLMPFGQILYAGERFEHTYGERPRYAEAEFTIKVHIYERDPGDLMREEQRWVHAVRESLTVDRLNAGDLAATKYVSRVSTESVRVETRKTVSTLTCAVSVRYREL